VGLGGLEPPTSRLSGARSSQLSYRPGSRARALHVPTQEIQRASLSSASQNRTASPDDDCGGTEAPENRADLKSTTPGLRLAGWAMRMLEASTPSQGLLRKEVIQPQVPLRLPCYDFTPVTNHSLGACLLAVGTATSGAIDSHGVTGGVYKARERIHRSVLICDY
jgi:hypothetical protein